MAGRIDLLILGWRALPAALWAVPLAAVAMSPRAALVRAPTAGVGGAVLAIGCTAALRFAGPIILLQDLAGFGLVLLGLCAWHGSAQKPSLARFANLGKLAMGVYLLHVVFIGACRSFAAHHGGSATVCFALWASAISLLCSTVATLLLLRVKWLRWLVGI
jgi:hypothetical protein